MPFIMLVVLIDMLSIGIIVPVLPSLVGQFTSNPTEQTYWYGVVAFAFAATSFVFSPVLGALSDAYGRRPGAAPRLLRPRDQLLRDRPRDRVLDADRVARDRRRDAGQCRGRERLRRRHHAARATREAFRSARCDVRHRLHRGSGDRRPARRHRRASAVLRGRRAVARQPRLRHRRAARVVVARADAVRSPSRGPTRSHR